MSGARETEPPARRGRKLGPLDPTAGPAQSFAADLRELRREAGDPSFVEMSRRVHWSTSALAAAARGDRLPTWSVTEGFVQALGGDLGLWRRRWEAAHRMVHGLAADPDATAASNATATLEATDAPGEETVREPDGSLAPEVVGVVRVDRPPVMFVAAPDGDQPARLPGRRFRRLMALVLLLALTAATTVVVVVRARVVAGADVLIASAEAARQADLVRSGNPALALRLGLAAYRLAPTPEARGALWSSAAAPYPISLPGGLGAPVASVTASPDGRVIAASSRDRNVARIWTIPDQSLPTLASDLKASIPAPVLFSPVGHLLAAAGPDRTVFLWDVSRPSRPIPISPVVSQVEAVGSMAFSPDGRVLAVAVPQTRTVRLLDVSDPARPAVTGILSDGGRELSTVVFSHDGRTIATADAAGTVKLWDVAERSHPRWTATIPFQGKVSAVAFSPTASLLAATGDGANELWDTADPVHPALKLRWPAPDGRSDGSLRTAIAFAAEGHFLLRATADRTVEVTNVNSGQRYARFTEDTPIRAGVFNAGGQDVVVGVDSGTVHLWRPLMPYTVANQPSGDQWGDFSATGHLMIGIGADGGSSLWVTANQHRPEVAASLPSPFCGGLFTPDGGTLITVSTTGAELWSVTSPRHPARLSTIAEPAGRCVSGATSMLPGTSTLALSAPDGSLAFWDVTSPHRPRLTATVQLGPPGAVATFAVSPAGGIIAVNVPGPRPAVRLVNVADAAHPRTIATLAVPTAGPENPADLEISGDGRVLAVIDRGNLVRLWNIADPSRPVAGQVLAHAATPGAMAFDPHSSLLAIGSSDSAVHLWDVRDVSHPVELIALPAGFAAEHLAFSPDGRLLAGGGQDGTTLLWGTTDPRHVTPVGRITFSNSPPMLPAVTTISFAPDGELLSVGLASRIQFLVDLNTDRLYHQYCALPDSHISRDEWNRYLSGVAYRPPC